MSFKENLLRKIKIDDLVGRVLASIGPPGSEKKLNKEAMQELIALSDFTYKRKRDLDLYIRQVEGGQDTILVLDNELALYRTTSEDVAMRKSPTVKEMVNIRNAIKILKDSDVVVSRRETTVKSIRETCIESLDLSYGDDDIAAIKKDGIAALENAYLDGVKEALSLLAELMGYTLLPASITVPHCYMVGRKDKKTSGEEAYGPVVIYNLMVNQLKLVDDPVGVYDKGKMEELHLVARGEREAPFEGAAVFEELAARFLKKEPQVDGLYKRT
ncbi:MAG: hypothetical protein LJE94_02120 [Deltaproteobacteria bacterium]|nr:hypothetical protein [Deltaproteobacteria bacterium]